jgi:hypothetical protein
MKKMLNLLVAVIFLIGSTAAFAGPNGVEPYRILIKNSSGTWFAPSNSYDFSLDSDDVLNDQWGSLINDGAPFFCSSGCPYAPTKAVLQYFTYTNQPYSYSGQIWDPTNATWNTAEVGYVTYGGASRIYLKKEWSDARSQRVNVAVEPIAKLSHTYQSGWFYITYTDATVVYGTI